MELFFNTVHFLEEVIGKEAKILEGFDADFSANVRIADPRFGDFQANGVLPYAKAKKKNPRELAGELVKALEGHLDSAFIGMKIAGPGFINFKLNAPFLLNWLERFKDEEGFHRASESTYHGKIVSVDYSSPNTAKQLHVGHIRSMIIGESVQRLLRFCGAKVIRDNHIGDWGTQFGILIMSIKDRGYDLDVQHEDVLEDLEDIYRKGNADFGASDEAKDRARSEIVKLQQGDPENVGIWQKIVNVSYDAFKSIYDQLGIVFDVVLGESFYRDKVERVYKELTETGIAKESDGALVVFHSNPNPKADDYPFIMRKKDGASNYATTDLATVLYHKEADNVDQMVYVTDGRQQDHFKYLFLTVEQWFKAKDYKAPKLWHVWFGTILGEGGKAIKTRSGNPVKLKDLLQEAKERAYKIVEEKNPGLSEEKKKHIARVVGIGAIKYFELAQNRTSDYVFTWDKVLAFEGNTAPYLLYALARIHSIFRKANVKPGEGEAEAVVFETEAELALARKLLAFPIVMEQTIEDFRPHILCAYLYELSGTFSSFYNADKVIVEDPKVFARRLLLCSRTMRVLETGLHLLGLETLEEM